MSIVRFGMGMFNVILELNVFLMTKVATKEPNVTVARSKPETKRQI